MAVDLNGGLSPNRNETRFYEVPSSTDFDLPATGDFTILVVAKHKIALPTRQYILSSGNVQVNNTYVLALSPDANDEGFAGYFANTSVRLWGNNNPTLDSYYVTYMSARSGSVFSGAARFGGGDSSESVSASTQKSVTTTNNLKFGTSLSESGDIFFQGVIDRVVIHHGHGITLAEADTIAGGELPENSSWWSNGGGPTAYWTLDDGTAATITDSIGGHVATRQGTGFGSDTTSPFAGPSVTKGLRIQLPITGPLSNVQYAAYDELTLGTQGTPVASSDTATVPSGGLLEIDVDANTSKNVGGECFVHIYHPDATDHKDSNTHIGRHTIIDIT